MAESTGILDPPTFDKRYLTIAVGLNHPFSRGFIVCLLTIHVVVF